VTHVHLLATSLSEVFEAVHRRYLQGSELVGIYLHILLPVSIKRIKGYRKVK
jgi:hypothetical protein